MENFVLNIDFHRKRSFLVYIVRFEEEMLYAKDGNDNGLVVMGSLGGKSLNFLGIFSRFSQEKKFGILKNMRKIKNLITQEIT